LTAHDLLQRKIIDAIIPEPAGGAQGNADAAAEQVKAFLARELTLLQDQPLERLLETRYAKYRKIGQ
ncbi:MAG: acetyl-CoA carboxylase carboxyl transferase subunit alpha, partial [Chloroflexi bacterium UTCFX4]